MGPGSQLHGTGRHMLQKKFSSGSFRAKGGLTVSSDDDRLLPSGHESWNVLADDGFTENGSA